MINTTALNLIPGDEVEINGEMWRVQDHHVCMNDGLPIQMNLVSPDRTCGKFVLTTATHPYKRAVRDCEDVHY